MTADRSPMTIARKGTRAITIDAIEYRWLVRLGKHHDLYLIIELTNESGQLLIAKLRQATIVTPWLVKKAIDYALGQGWQPQQSGPDFIIRIYGSLQTPENWEQANKISGTDCLVLNTWNPSPALLSRWAYDETLCLEGCDEDLVLHEQRYLSVLIPLADDEQCPKADYILTTLAHYICHSFRVSKNSNTEELLAEAIELAERCTSPAMERWAALLKRQWTYGQGIGRITSSAEAYSIAEDILNGMYRSVKITLIADTDSYFEFGFDNSKFPLNRERLILNKETGTFTYRRNLYR